MDVKIIQEFEKNGIFSKKKIIVDNVDISSIVSSVQVNISGSDPTFAKITLSNMADYSINLKAEDIYIESIPLSKDFKRKLYNKLKEEFGKDDEHGEN